MTLEEEAAQWASFFKLAGLLLDAPIAFVLVAVPAEVASSESSWRLPDFPFSHASANEDGPVKNLLFYVSASTVVSAGVEAVRLVAIAGTSWILSGSAT